MGTQAVTAENTKYVGSLTTAEDALPLAGTSVEVEDSHRTEVTNLAENCDCLWFRSPLATWIWSN